jgi:hypothetical protein
LLAVAERRIGFRPLASQRRPLEADEFADTLRTRNEA